VLHAPGDRAEPPAALLGDDPKSDLVVEAAAARGPGEVRERSDGSGLGKGSAARHGTGIGRGG